MSTINFMIFVFAGIGTFMATWGSQTDGTLSPAMGGIGALIWISSVVAAFFTFGIGRGSLFLLGTLALGAILSPILPKRY